MKTFLSVLNILFLLGILVWPFAAFASMFSFDAPGSTDNLIVWGLVLSILAYPLPAIIGNILFWKNRKKGSDAKLAKYTWISASGYICVIVFMLFLEVACNGRFGC